MRLVCCCNGVNNASNYFTPFQFGIWFFFGGRRERVGRNHWRRDVCSCRTNAAWRLFTRTFTRLFASTLRQLHEQHSFGLITARGNCFQMMPRNVFIQLSAILGNNTKVAAHFADKSTSVVQPCRVASPPCHCNCVVAMSQHKPTVVFSSDDVA